MFETSNFWITFFYVFKRKKSRFLDFQKNVKNVFSNYGGRRHLEFTYGVDFLYGRFWTVAGYVPAKFRESISFGGWVIEVFQKIQNGGCRPSWIIFGYAGPPTKFSCWPEVCVQILCLSDLYFRRYLRSNIQSNPIFIVKTQLTERNWVIM